MDLRGLHCTEHFKLLGSDSAPLDGNLCSGGATSRSSDRFFPHSHTIPFPLLFATTMSARFYQGFIDAEVFNFTALGGPSVLHVHLKSNLFATTETPMWPVTMTIWCVKYSCCFLKSFINASRTTLSPLRFSFASRTYYSLTQLGSNNW